MDEALLILLGKKDYEFITIKELCQKAGVNRSTFYLHYESMDDLLKETIEMVESKFSSKFDDVKDNVDTNNSILTNEKYLLPYLTFIKENKKVYQLMHDKPSLFEINKKSSFLYKTIFSKALTNFGVKEEEKKYIFNFYLEGVLAIIKKWLEDDCKDDINIINLDSI